VKVNPNHKWAKVSGFRRRFEGFWVYLMAALYSLIDPIEIDKIMLKVLSEEFEQDE
jgi:hypothetical protein